MVQTFLLDTVQAVLFDLDGTLLDTFEFIYGAFEYTLEHYGAQPHDRASISQLMGGPLEDVYHTMAPSLDAVILTETHRTFQSNNLRLVSLFPSTLEVLQHLKSRGIKIAAVTTRSLRTSVRSLEVTGIANYFDVIVSAEDVTNHKPHPEPLLSALKSLGLRPEDAIMVGDTHADILAGKNAGMKTVAALYGFGGERLLGLEPDYVIRELGELLSRLS